MNNKMKFIKTFKDLFGNVILYGILVGLSIFLRSSKYLGFISWVLFAFIAIVSLISIFGLISLIIPTIILIPSDIRKIKNGYQTLSNWLWLLGGVLLRTVEDALFIFAIYIMLNKLI